MAGIASAHGPDGALISARLMGGPDQCLQIKLPITAADTVLEFCTLPWPHSEDHDYQGRLEEAS